MGGRVKDREGCTCDFSNTLISSEVQGAKYMIRNYFEIRLKCQKK